MKLLWQLYSTFFRIGLFTFGGGYAMFPMLTREVVERHQWATDDDLMDYYVIAQCTPGIIAINTATFVGAKVAGNRGGVVATLGVISPCYLIICTIASLLVQVHEYPIVQHALTGVAVTVCAMTAITIWNLAKKSVKGALTLGIFCMAPILVTLLHVSPAVIVVLASALGILAGRKGGAA